MQNTECSKLAASYGTKAAQGLVDVKFYISNSGETLSEAVCEEVNRLDEAVARGEVFELEFDDRHG
jgi:hypothetical protein